MRSRFDKIFHPTDEEIKAREKFLEKIHNECIEDRKNVKLVLHKDGLLYMREPFKSFLGDCRYCSHYVDPNVGFVEGGDCKLHRIGCGNGFTCKDNDSEWAIQVED